MYSRVLCVFCLLASPAFSATITVSTDRSGTSFDVRDGDVLRIVDGGSTGRIRMWGESQLLVSGGTVAGQVTIETKQGVIGISGGEFLESITFPNSTYSSGTVDITGGVFRKGFSVSDQGGDEPSGDFDITVSGGEWHRKLFIEKGQTLATIYGRYFETSEAFVPIDGLVRTVRGILDNGNPFLAKSVNNHDAFTVHAQLDSLIPGDADADGSVDLDDMNLVRNNFGASGELEFGDTNFDNVVDLDDLNAVRNNFGASSHPVPEPASIGLVLVALTFLATKSLGSSRRTSPPSHRQQS